MRVEGSERVELPRLEVWARLQDPAVLKRCTPGLTSLEESGPDRYDAVLELQLAAIRGRFTGSVEYVERLGPERMRLRLSGKGGPGFVEGEATFLLEAAGEATDVRYHADVQVGGQIARLGQRMISGVGKEMAGQFFEAFSADVSPSNPTATQATPAGARSFFVLLWRSFLNLLGLSRRS